jgi:hypothetical protein
MLHKLCLLRSANDGNNASAVMMARGDFEIFFVAPKKLHPSGRRTGLDSIASIA